MRYQWFSVLLFGLVFWKKGDIRRKMKGIANVKGQKVAELEGFYFVYYLPWRKNTGLHQRPMDDDLCLLVGRDGRLRFSCSRWLLLR
jgi:hypothetical protein